jgi:hypothetical protein
MILNLFGALVLGLLLAIGLDKRARVAQPAVVEQSETLPEGVVTSRHRPLA